MILFLANIDFIKLNGGFNTNVVTYTNMVDTIYSSSYIYFYVVYSHLTILAAASVTLFA